MGLNEFACWILSDCPGTESEQAGKTSACQGCPNQKLCASGATKAPDPGMTAKQQLFIMYEKYGSAPAHKATNIWSQVYRADVRFG